MAGPTETSPLNAENIEKVKVKATEAGKNVVAYAVSVANGNASIRVMALAGGAAMVFDSIGNFFNNLFRLNFIQAIIAFYAFMVGASAVIMESDKDAIPYAEKLRGIIGKNLGVVRTVTGRGLFYGVAATLEISQGNRRSTIIGWVELFIGISYIVLGYRASEKLKATRNKIWPEKKVRKMFQKYDIDGNDKIEFEEFYKLLQDMNIDLSIQEAEVMYMSLDKDMSHGLPFVEFQKFWSNSAELNSFRV